MAGRWVPCRGPGLLHYRDVYEAQSDALQEPPGYGDRGKPSQPACRWRRIDGRLRQNHSRFTYGCYQHEPAGYLPSGWTYAAWKLERPAARQRYRSLEVLD